MNDHCPICYPPSSCKGYPRLWANLRADPEKHRGIHDRLNAMRPADDLMVAEIIFAAIATGSPPENGSGIPIGRKCCG